MALLNVFDIASSALSAQSIRLNVIASNLANADSVGSSPDNTYRARQPFFETMYKNKGYLNETNAGVRVAAIVESEALLKKEYRPLHPSANEQGYVFLSNVEPIEEMANMIAASRNFQNNIEIIHASKKMLIDTLKMG